MKLVDIRRSSSVAWLSWVLCSAALAPAHGQTAEASPRPPSPVQRVLMPGRMVTDSGFANGCWVRFYDGIDYRGAQLLLVGPLDVPRLTDTGEPLRDWDSVVVGPKALVTTYEEDDFGKRGVTLEPGRRIADLTRTTGRIRDFRSIRVNCSLG